MSREPELYKDKIEVSLDGRQIFYLFFGGAVIVGLVFVLGVMVGRRVEARGHVDRAHVQAAVDPLAALDRLEGGSGLSFQGALRGAPVAPPPVDRAIDAQARTPIPAARPDQLDHVQKKAEAKHDEAKADDLDKPDEARKHDAARKQDESKKQDDARKQDDAKQDEPKKKVAAKPDAKPAVADDADHPDKPSGDHPRFTLQLSSFQDRDEAEAYVRSVKDAGFHAFVTQGEVDGKQFYRVRLGSYRTLDAANDAKADFEKTAKKSALVIKL